MVPRRKRGQEWNHWWLSSRVFSVNVVHTYLTVPSKIRLHQIHHGLRKIPNLLIHLYSLSVSQVWLVSNCFPFLCLFSIFEIVKYDFSSLCLLISCRVTSWHFPELIFFVLPYWIWYSLLLRNFPILPILFFHRTLVVTNVVSHTPSQNVLIKSFCLIQ